jgi:hypothetical protein
MTTRRTFLKAAGLALAGLGMGEAGLSLGIDRYGQALAQSGKRKLALLIGINDYSAKDCDCVPLQGCLTDVELQRQLLIHRFGFAPSDIVILTDRQATRSQIETAFLEHLIAQAQSDDLVLFHFSGYGSTIEIQGETSKIQPSLVAIDSTLPKGKNPVINDLPAETLLLLLRSLPTRRTITVLDTSCSINPTAVLRTAVRLRSRPKAALGQLSTSALEFQQSLQKNFKASTPFAFPGLRLSAAVADQAAVELRWAEFSAGVFTYCLTQQLWQAIPATTLYIDLQQVTARMIPIVQQVQTPSFREEKFTSVLSLKQNSFATWGLQGPFDQGIDGAITGIDRFQGEVQLWLGGLAAQILATYKPKARVIVASNPLPGNISPFLLQIQWRDQLRAGARLVSAPEGMGLDQLAVGQGIQEKTRLLPQQSSLTIALDTSLDRIERIDATSAFAGMPKVDGITLGDRPTDYVFGRISELASNLNGASSPLQGIRYGLFAPGQDVLPGTVSTTEEAVKTAVQRLEPRFRSLLAIKMLRLLENHAVTTVPMEMQLLDQSEGKGLVQYRSERAMTPGRTASNTTLLSMPAGHQVRYQPVNLSDRPLYALMLMYESDGDLSIGYPPELHQGSQNPPLDWRIPPSTDESPFTNNLEWVLPTVSNQMELLLILSVAPLQKTLQTGIFAWAGEATATKPVSDSLSLAEALIEDLHQASLEFLEGSLKDGLALDVAAWAAVRLTCQVTA